MNVLAMLFGAALVIVGVLASALADRIRGLRSATPRARVIPARDTVLAGPTTPTGIEDVVSALTNAGFSKAQAARAALECPATDRHSAENWVKCALRRMPKVG